MVAVGRENRRLRHVSRPLRRQMTRLIDRGRWPVLVTYHDEGQGHTGHVYKCSGWERVGEGIRRPFYVDAEGRRVSPYANGSYLGRDLVLGGMTTVHRWEHWACERGRTAEWMSDHGWQRVPIPGRVWKSGNQAHRWIRS